MSGDLLRDVLRMTGEHMLIIAIAVGVAILLGIDRFMSEARSITNLIGNGVATIVIARSEKEFDPVAFRLATDGGQSGDGTAK